MSGRPVVAPAWSLQLRMSSTVVIRSAVVPTMATSLLHASISAFRVSFGLSCES